MAYIKQAYGRHIYSGCKYEQNNKLVSDVDDRFKSELNTIAITLPQITWQITRDMYYPYYFTHGEGVVLSNVIPLEGLTIMASVPNSVFDLSLLEYYRSILDYCRQNSTIFKDKKIDNLLGILNAVDFLLKRQEIQEQLLKCPKESDSDIVKFGILHFTQEKFAKLLFLCREIGLEQGDIIFEQHQAKIQITASLLGSLASWSSNTSFENCLQRVDGNLPAGIVGFLTKNYTTELEQLRNCSANCPADETDKKAQEIYECFASCLSQMLTLSKQQSIICGKQDFGPELRISNNPEGEGRYLNNILPVKAIQLMKEQFSIQLNPSLFISYLHTLASIDETFEEEEEGGKQPQKIINYHTLLEAIYFLMQENAYNSDKSFLVTSIESEKDVAKMRLLVLNPGFSHVISISRIVTESGYMSYVSESIQSGLDGLIHKTR